MSVIRRFATPRQRRMSLVAAVLGNVVPIVILGLHHQRAESHRLLIVLVGTTVAIVSPIAVNLIPMRSQWLVRLAALSGLVGLTLMQASVGGASGVDSPYAVLLVMPMVWFGLMTTGADLKAGCVLVLACCFVPTLTFPQYYGQPAHALAPALAIAVVAVTVALSLAGLTREAKRLTEQLRDAAVVDQLTELLNRRGWEEVTRHKLEDRSPADPVCVALLDLDNLKVVNDSMGHDEGDALLSGFGRRLHETFGREAAVARLGGDEFAILTIGRPVDHLVGRVQALCARTPQRAGFSAGVALAAPGESLRDAMRRADLALYEVKTTGRGRCLLADASVGANEA